MILAEASPALGISITLLIIVHVVVSLLMILVVMMQRPKQEGLGAAFGGGMTDQLLGAGTTSFLQKATVTLGIFFFVISLVLAILIGKSNKARGLTLEKEASTTVEAAPAIPGDVLDGEKDDLIDALETGGAPTGAPAQVEGEVDAPAEVDEPAPVETPAEEEADAPVEGEEVAPVETPAETPEEEGADASEGEDSSPEEEPSAQQ